MRSNKLTGLSTRPSSTHDYKFPHLTLLVHIMPFIIERRQPPTVRNQTRSSGIPRIAKQLLLNTNSISHASKPSTDAPSSSPAKRIANGGGQPSGELHGKYSYHYDPDPEVAILELVAFGSQPIVSFGQVPINHTHIKYVVVRNQLDSQQRLVVKSFPKTDKGFNIDATEFIIAPRTEISVALAWTPKTVGSVRETILLQDVNRLPKRIVMIGTAIRLKPPPSSSKHIPRLNMRPNFMKPSPSKLRRCSRETIHAALSPRTNRPVNHTGPIRKPLTSLIYASRRRQSAQIVKKILSQKDEVVMIKVQSYCRMVLQKRQAEELRVRNAAILKLQSYFRMILARKELCKLKCRLSAIIKLQSYWRSLLVRKEYRKIVMAIVVIQTHYRGYATRKSFARLKRDHAALTKVQSYIRMILAKRDHMRQKRRVAAAILIQSRWRSLVARRKYLHIKRVAIIIQSHCRRFLARKGLELMRKQSADATRVQSYFRMIIARQKYLELKRKVAAAVLIQSHWRGQIAKRKYHCSRRAIIVIQSHYRRYLAKILLQKMRERWAATIKVQSYARMIIAKRNYHEHKRMISAAIVIQSHWRCLLSIRLLRELKQQMRAAITIQSLWRGYIVRSKLIKSIEAIFSIQTRCKVRRHNLTPGCKTQKVPSPRPCRLSLGF